MTWARAPIPTRRSWPRSVCTKQTPGLVRGLVDKPDARRRVCAVLGGSQWLGDYVIADPARAVSIWEDPARAGRCSWLPMGATRA